MKNSAESAIAATLELTATERPELLDFQLEAFLNSPMRFAVLELANAFGVPREKLALTAYKACLDLDKLEKRRGVWRNPAQVLESPNVAALYQLCSARQGRVPGITRRRRLEAICQKLELAWELARDRAWIEAFIGPPLPAEESSNEGRAQDDQSST